MLFAIDIRLSISISSVPKAEKCNESCTETQRVLFVYLVKNILLSLNKAPLAVLRMSCFSRARFQTRVSRMDLRRRFETLRRPFGFNYVHYLLIELYNGSSTLIKSYPLYPVFARLQRKLHLDAREETSARASAIIEALISILSENDAPLTESVEQTHLNLNTYPIACLFRLYSPMHLLLFMEPMLIFDNARLHQLIQGVFVREYPKEKCDYIHFGIAHRKTRLLIELLGATDDQWLIKKINTPSDRAWLPIHYVSRARRTDSLSDLCLSFRLPMLPIEI